ncbi:MAG: ATP-binding protein [Candidatus Aegiribacteria sp.]
MNSKGFNFPIPDDACAMLVSSSGVSRMSKPLSSLLDGLPMDSGAAVRAMSVQEDGSMPVMLGDRVWLSSSTGAGENRLVILKSPSKLELDEWLENSQGDRPCMLTDASGRVFAATESANSLFSGFDRSSLADILDRISMTAFLSAASRCLSGERPRDFSVLSRKGRASRISQVMSLKKTGVMNALIVVSFHSPSMAISSIEQDTTKLSLKLFSAIPVPALRVDLKTKVLSMNSCAASLLSGEGTGPAARESFLDMIAPEDRDRVIALHRNRDESVMRPFQFRTRVSMSNGLTGQYEVTSLLMPDRESFMLFLIPEKNLEGGKAEPMGVRIMPELLNTLETTDDPDGNTRTILDFLRVGTGARGAAYISRSRRVSVGETSLPTGDPKLKTAREPFWTESENGCDFTVPVRQQHDQAMLRVTGIPSRRSDPLFSLVVALAPLLADFLHSGHRLERILRLLNSIASFMTLIQGRERNTQALLGEIGSIVGADYLVLHNVSSREPVLKPLVSWGSSSEQQELRIEIPSIASWAYTHSEICYVPDTAVDQRFSSVFPSSRSEMSIPLVADGMTMGTLTIGCTRRDGFAYPTGGFLESLGAALSLWLFRESRGTREDDGEGERETGENIPGLEDLLLSLSYHMKAPLTALRGNADLMTSGRLGDLTPEQREAIDSIGSSTVQLTEYTEGLLNFMKMELGQEGLETSWARPSDVVSSLLPLLAEKGDDHDVSVSAELPEEPFTASFDRSRLEQIIYNLADNAMKYNRPGGLAKIEVRMDGTNHWILEVFNTGEGISPEDLPNVFDRFYVGGAGGREGGLGIGLTIVRSFVQQMGGTVSVRSREGTGSWFTVRFPVS